MNIFKLLSTEEREKILSYLLEHPSERINMNGLARRLDLSPGQIHKYVTLLRKFRLVENDRLKETPFTGAFRLINNLKRIEKSNAINILKKAFPATTGVGMYGSWATGTNLEEADLDLWLKMKKEPADEEISRVRKELEEKIGAPVDIIIATPERLEHLYEKSDSFYFSLYNSVILWGECL